METGKSMIGFGQARVEIRRADGSLKTQWQDNFVYRAIKQITHLDIRIPVLTGYPTKLKKLN